MKKSLLIAIFYTLTVNADLAAFQNKLGNPSSWSEVQKNKKGEIEVYWFTTNPFIFEDEKGNITGIEPLIFSEFQSFLKKKYDVDLSINYIKSESFIETYYNARDNNRSGVFGASAFSITEDRKAEVKFAKPYMPDITVLISNTNVPIVDDKSDFKETFKGLKAITIKGTTYEKDLLRVKEEWGVDFEMQYISSNHNIFKVIAETDSSFGFIDLPIYLIQLHQNPSINLHRQNILPIKREGYSFILPKNSDWEVILNEFFVSEDFENKIEDITANYLDRNLYQFIEDFYLKADNNVVLLTKEKEMQYMDLKGKSEKLAKEIELKYYLLTALILIIFFSGIIFYLYIKRNKINVMLTKQAEKIALQTKDIERQKIQLEKRNSELTVLNEEKNTLIKVLAHDLRTPINQIQGFSNIVLIETKKLSQDQITYLHKIKDITLRVNKMIGKILDVDAIETGRVNLIIEDINVSELIKYVITTFSYEAERKDIEIEFIDQIPSETLLKLDRVYATQVLENLISNALKFSNNNTKVFIHLKLTESSVVISVKDQGPGFTEDDKGRLFHKFQQLSARPTSGEKSTGLGLSIVKKYVELMNGKVWCDSEEGKGATFFIEFFKS